MLTIGKVLLKNAFSFGVLEVGTLDVCTTISDHLATYIYSVFIYSLGFSYTRTVWSNKSGDFDNLNDLNKTKISDFFILPVQNFTSILMLFCVFQIRRS